VSGSQSKTSTSSSQATNVSELNLQDTGGITIADNSGGTKLVYNSSTSDYGAVGDALDGISKVANNAITGNSILAQNLSSDVSSAAVTLGMTAIDTGGQIANRGLDNAQAAYESGLSFGSNALNTVAALLNDSASREASLTSSALSGYQSIAQQNSASDATQVQKIAGWAIAAAVALVVLPKVFK
jgi:hypothetical protein